MSDPSNAAYGRLFVGGERLRIAVDSVSSGGGEKYEPQTADQARRLLQPMVHSVVEAAEALPPRLRGERIYVEARLLPNYLAPSHFPGAILTEIDAIPVGSRADVGQLRTKSTTKTSGTRRLILALEDSGLARLRNLIDHPADSRSARNAFAEIRKLDRVSLASKDEVVLGRPDDGKARVTWEAVLHPAATRFGELGPLDAHTMKKWFDLVEELEGRSHRDFVRQVGGLTFAPIVLAAENVDAIARFNPLRALRPMPTVRPRPQFGPRVADRSTRPSSTRALADSPRVGVFDGGLRAGGAFFPEPAIDLTPEAPTDSDLDHGTGVMGAVMYGLANPGATARQPPCPVDHLRVLPAPHLPSDLDGYWVLDEIKKAVEANSYDIVNLSLGPRLAVEDSTEPNRWTSELDQLAWERDVLFVVAAGNDGDQDQLAGLHRVQVPADMVNGLSVGACDVASPDSPWTRAAYSSMGPGRHGNRVQPAGVQFGGTPARPFPVLRADGSFLDAHGTSFAAPLVTHALADLATRLPKPTPSVLRAFAVHFAERHRKHRKLVDELGHGRLPLEFASFLDSGADEAHVLFVDEIEHGELLGYQLPVPDSASGPLAVTITLAYLAPVEPSEPTEYTRASLELAFRPHHLLHRYTPPRGATEEKSVILNRTSPDAFTRLRAFWDESQQPITKALGAPPGSSETALRDAGKWETVRHHRVSLRAGETEQPRLELSYLARRAGLLDRAAASPVPFALIVSIEDKEKSADFYDRVRAQFPALVPLPRSQVRVRATGARTLQ